MPMDMAFVTECRTKLKRQKTFLTHGEEGAQEGAQCVRTLRQNPLCRKAGSDKECDESDKRVNWVNGGRCNNQSASDEVAVTVLRALFCWSKARVLFKFRECRELW